MSDETTPGPESDWEDVAPTILTGTPLDALPPEGEAPEAVPEEVTKPHDLTPVLEQARDAGCRACYGEGQESIIIALRQLYAEKWRGKTVDEMVAELRRRSPLV